MTSASAAGVCGAGRRGDACLGGGRGGENGAVCLERVGGEGGVCSGRLFHPEADGLDIIRHHGLAADRGGLRDQTAATSRKGKVSCSKNTSACLGEWQPDQRRA